MTEGVLLTLQDVTIERGGLPLASGISFSLKPGEVIVLRGPNGSGKTTLLRTIAGLQPVARGEIDVDPDEERLRRCGFTSCQRRPVHRVLKKT